MTPQITQNGESLSIRFNSFGADAYPVFLKAKALPESNLSYDYADDSYTIETHARYANLLGVAAQTADIAAPEFPEFLFEHQREILKIALTAKRFAVWANVGLGKTLIELEFARQVSVITGGGRVLIFTLNEIVGQTIEEAEKFYGDSLPLLRIESREQMRLWAKGEFAPEKKIAITNYEKMNPDETGQIVSELKNLAGVVLDESSRLKAGGGKQKWALIKSCKGIEYKLSATATPAPNDYIEFASQASFLERMRNENEIIWTFFKRDKLTQEWTVKRHAREAFFEWMAAWSIYLKLPQSFGWSSDFVLPPEPEIFHHEIPITGEQIESSRLFNLNTHSQPSLFVQESQGVVGRSKLSQIAKGFVYLDNKRVERIESNKPKFVADLIEREVGEGLQVLVWTLFDAETDIIADLLGETSDRREDLKRRLNFAKSEYAKTERQMFAEIPSGKINPKHTATTAAVAARKTEFLYFLENFGEEIKRLDAELADLELESEIAQLENKQIGGLIRGEDFEILSGATSKPKRAEILERFRSGKLPVLISKASLLGYGMNFQSCGSMVFSGWNDSFESFYQAVGRAVRYGQQKRVRIHLPFVRELEFEQLENVFRKQSLFEAAILEQEKAYIKAMQKLRIL